MAKDPNCSKTFSATLVILCTHSKVWSSLFRLNIQLDRFWSRADIKRNCNWFFSTWNREMWWRNCNGPNKPFTHTHSYVMSPLRWIHYKPPLFGIEQGVLVVMKNPTLSPSKVRKVLLMSVYLGNITSGPWQGILYCFIWLFIRLWPVGDSHYNILSVLQSSMLNNDVTYGKGYSF